MTLDPLQVFVVLEARHAVRLFGRIGGRIVLSDAGR